MSEGTYKYLPPHLADRLRGLGIGVRKQMEGGMQGLHRSPAFGSSVEFAEYRAYVPGDPIRRIDWAVYARTDRHVIRQFHDEVNVRAYVLLDISESMAFPRHPGRAGAPSKMEYASFLAAGIMYLMVQQRDSTALFTFDDDIRRSSDPVSSFVGLKPMLLALEEIEPTRPGNIAKVLHSAAEKIVGRCLVILISDLLQDPAEVLHGIGHLTHDGKEVTVFQVLDPSELRLPMDGLCEIEALESHEKLVVDIAQVRDRYLERLRGYLDEVRTGCTNAGADYYLVDTQMDVRDALYKRSILS
jgi:uncharacterized protein (DUF58 family)